MDDLLDRVIEAVSLPPAGQVMLTGKMAESCGAGSARMRNGMPAVWQVLVQDEEDDLPVAMYFRDASMVVRINQVSHLSRRARFRCWPMRPDITRDGGSRPAYFAMAIELI